VSWAGLLRSRALTRRHFSQDTFSVLHLAAGQNLMGVMRILLENGVDVNVKIDVRALRRACV
jgi:hypothetical protein